MAQHKSAEKRNRQSKVRNERNSAVSAKMRSAIKKARAAASTKGADQAAAFKAAISEINRAATKNVLKKETASRYVSRLMRAANAAR